jgi:hypothetical protein
MVVLLLLTILVVLIMGFWGEEGLVFLIIIGVGALVLIALGIILLLFGVSVGSVLHQWNSNVVPFWDAHKEILEPPLVSTVIVAAWIFAARKFWVAVRGKISQFSLTKDTAFEKIMFFLVAVPSLLVFLMLILVGFMAPIIFVVREMQDWWFVISAK